jgi:hypothetical protein
MFSSLIFRPGRLPAESSQIWHYPRFRAPLRSPRFDVGNLEQILAQWFGAPVILTATGKSAMELYFQAKGYHPYRTKVHVPPYFARPLMGSLGRSIFPVLEASPDDPVIHYHQYGFPQRSRPPSHDVLEDIAHSFYASVNSGSRNWSGEVAVFSLQKLFPLAGQAGGMVVHDEDIYNDMRARLEAKPLAPENIAAWVRSTLYSAYTYQASEPAYGEDSMHSFAYELVHDFPHPDPLSLAGCPTSLPGFMETGRKRKQIVEIYFRYFHDNALLRSFWDREEFFIPFAIPHFGTGDETALHKADRVLFDRGISSGIYRVDHNRNMYAPNYLPCLLLPSHQNIPTAKFEEICAIVKDISG